MSRDAHCVQIGPSLSDAAAAPGRRPGTNLFVVELQPERGPVPSTSMSGKARRSRSLRRCRIRSASVSGYGPATRSSNQRPTIVGRSRSQSRRRARRVPSVMSPEIINADRWCRRSMGSRQSEPICSHGSPQATPRHLAQLDPESCSFPTDDPMRLRIQTV
jgi:hypothetical protein